MLSQIASDNTPSRLKVKLLRVGGGIYGTPGYFIQILCYVKTSVNMQYKYTHIGYNTIIAIYLLLLTVRVAENHVQK